MENLQELKLNSPLDIRKQIIAVEKLCLQAPQVPCPVIHRFGPGIYIREVNIPAGTFSIGHHQKFDHLNIFLQGSVTMINAKGEPEYLEAPMLFTAKPGRKIGFIHTDMVWLNIYATNERDIEKLEQTYLDKSNGWQEDYVQRQQIARLKAEIDRQDYEAMLKEIGVDWKQVWEQSNNTADMVDLPYGSYTIKTGPSAIHGTGLFATATIEAGSLIAPARIDGLRTIAGRYTNHSRQPNAIMAKDRKGDIILMALRDIECMQGGQDGEEITIDYRESYRLVRGEACQQ